MVDYVKLNNIFHSRFLYFALTDLDFRKSCLCVDRCSHQNVVHLQTLFMENSSELDRAVLELLPRGEGGSVANIWHILSFQRIFSITASAQQASGANLSLEEDSDSQKSK